MGLSKYVFWECYYIRNHLDIKCHRSWENLVNAEPPVEALLKNSFLLDKGFPYLNSGLVSSPCRLVLCHRVGEASSSKAEEESLDELPFLPLFWWLEPLGLMFIIMPGELPGLLCLSQAAALVLDPVAMHPSLSWRQPQPLHGQPNSSPPSFLFHSSSSSTRIKPIWI